MKRRPLHAGSWYNSDRKQLECFINSSLEKANTNCSVQKCVKGIIVPHAGYQYCGFTAAHSWLTLLNDLSLRERIKRIFILGPSHHIGTRKILLPHQQTTEYITPLGSFKLDCEVISSLFEKYDMFERMELQDDECEHSIEMQLPFLRYVLNHIFSDSSDCNITICPLVVGSLTCQDIQNCCMCLKTYFESTGSLFIVSSDFCHWGHRFRFTYLPTIDKNSINEKIAVLDYEAIDYIKHHDKERFRKYIETTGNTICGEMPIKLFLELITACKLNLETSFLHYSQSSHIINTNKDTSVSYSSLVTYYCSSS